VLPSLQAESVSNWLTVRGRGPGCREDRL